MTSKSLPDVKNKALLQTKGYINHAWVDAASGATFDVINPATLEKLATVPEMGVEEVDRAVEAAAAAFVSYKKTSARQRARWLRKWSDLCHENIEDLALIMTLENGKTLTEAKGEVVYAASFLEWFAGEAERVHGEVIPTANLNQRIVTIKQPLGVAACLAPWNFPVAVCEYHSEAVRNADSWCIDDLQESRSGIGSWMHDCLEASRRDTTERSCSSGARRAGRFPQGNNQRDHHSRQSR
jgi:succinate-semialdehyde dehydrogenase/glutarate-semialdehyde dehydrogenase